MSRSRTILSGDWSRSPSNFTLSTNWFASSGVITVGSFFGILGEATLRAGLLGKPSSCTRKSKNARNAERRRASVACVRAAAQTLGHEVTYRVRSDIVDWEVGLATNDKVLREQG